MLEILIYIIWASWNADIDPETSLRIAACESRFDPTAQNAHSSASGIFQFIDGTWDNYCEGDKLNYKDSTDCFVKLYKAHPTWWSASQHCWGK